MPTATMPIITLSIRYLKEFRVGCEVDRFPVHPSYRTRVPVTACAGGGLPGVVTKCWKEEGSNPRGNNAKT